jgi:hypothetical protein
METAVPLIFKASKGRGRKLIAKLMATVEGLKIKGVQRMVVLIYLCKNLMCLYC